jgi:hypothetical protein
MTDEDDAEQVAPVPAGELARETAPPAELLEQVVAALAARGLLKPAPLRRASRAPMVAGMAATLAVGIGMGVLLPRPAPRQDRFVLLLHATPSAAEPAGDEARRVREYGDWARELRRRGVPIRGEKLADEVLSLGPAAASADPVSGYFVLGVTDVREAMAVAGSCPHLRHGGRVEVRRIESR